MQTIAQGKVLKYKVASEKKCVTIKFCFKFQTKIVAAYPANNFEMTTVIWKIYSSLKKIS